MLIYTCICKNCNLYHETDLVLIYRYLNDLNARSILMGKYLYIGTSNDLELQKRQLGK